MLHFIPAGRELSEPCTMSEALCRSVYGRPSADAVALLDDSGNVMEIRPAEGSIEEARQKLTEYVASVIHIHGRLRDDTLRAYVLDPTNGKYVRVPRMYWFGRELTPAQGDEYVLEPIEEATGYSAAMLGQPLMVPADDLPKWEAAAQEAIRRLASAKAPDENEEPVMWVSWNTARLCLWAAEICGEHDRPTMLAQWAAHGRLPTRANPMIEGGETTHGREIEPPHWRNAMLVGVIDYTKGAFEYPSEIGIGSVFAKKIELHGKKLAECIGLDPEELGERCNVLLERYGPKEIELAERTAPPPAEMEEASLPWMTKAELRAWVREGIAQDKRLTELEATYKQAFPSRRWKFGRDHLRKVYRAEYLVMKDEPLKQGPRNSA